MNEKKLDEALTKRFSTSLEDAHLLLSDPDTIRDAAAQAAESVADYVRKHPLQVVGAALVVGLVAGFMIYPKTKRQHL